MCCAYHVGPGLAEALGFREADIRPTDRAPVLLARPEGLAAAILRFGIPSRRGGRPVLNARSETLCERPMFRGLLATGRAVVPATSFDEWNSEGIRFTLSDAGGKSLHLAALHDGANFVIITTETAGIAAGIHARMPLLLSRELARAWLSGGAQVPELLQSRPPVRLRAAGGQVRPSLL